jgi:diguanylate cyclase (GGDEF)-like protein/PAS domain S-box-containing protein
MTDSSSVDVNFFATAMECIPDAVIVTDANLELPGPSIIYVNNAFTKMTGYTKEEVIGKSPRLLQGPSTNTVLMKKLKSDLAAGREFYGETVNYRKDGTEFFVQWRVGLMRLDGETVSHYIAIERDVTDRVKTLLDLEVRATTDAMTSALNKSEITERLGKILFTSNLKQNVVSVIILDLDQFKKLNDTFGHLIGDEALKTTSSLVINELGEKGLVGRWGGDEFLIVLPGISFVQAKQIAHDVCDLIEQNNVLKRWGVTGSCGVATSQVDDSITTLLDRADKGLYAAKT